MQARVMLLRVQDGKMDQLIDVVKGDIEPVLYGLEGFHAGFLFTDRETNRALTSTIWGMEWQAR